VATRYLNIEGSRAKVKVELGKPYRTPTESACEFRISYGRKTIRKAAFGEDSFQSLELALRLLPTYLRHAAKIPVSKTFLYAPGDDMGFPEVSV
jgi:hypothetical protein